MSQTKAPDAAPSYATGHLAFPACTWVTPEEKLRTLHQLFHAQQNLQSQKTNEQLVAENAEQKKRVEAEQAWEKYLGLEEKRRRVREEREREEALKGEKHWVRHGGILRDANGRRDYKRTDEIRKIVEREDKERRIIERWRAYENAWINILASADKALSFGDIPWPLASPPKSPDDLRDPTKIADFLFESLTIESNKTTRKERLRTSLLRWHPDKLGGILARVPEGELDAVKDGIDAVVISLMKLQEAEKMR
ncbi:uncharacterized protein FOMMEDRAFT_78190 [Fomitiporia mediterranea MF3/22]|uniref:uncharacterized protein n=1 Tax=Fomitiporia mediterranea (strain MF3/22) TaxID=694068 RepID=UPI00044090A8|nr:uncharacterized protein FOMMEDRAFT_78190 [Fomitiporia mediterranea MF3/22]EJD05620.1 hypothetical protein FOMMEDRAFT_78190 [Fomitiporia mediterranea MF3/22]